MSDINTKWVIAGAALLFLLYLLLKLLLAVRPTFVGSAEARQRLRDAKARARATGSDAAARAAAWREAAAIAQGDLRRPNLAASYAAQALRSDMTDVEAVNILARALRASRRHRTLEKWLWKCLATPNGPVRDAAFAELVSLYEGPMRRAEWATALKQLQSTANTASK
jgi:hypothetical protein